MASYDINNRKIYVVFCEKCKVEWQQSENKCEFEKCPTCSTDEHVLLKSAEYGWFIGGKNIRPRGY